jgi:hypothetical protein
MDNPDPRYAVLLKGKWGSGKSYFIKNWINDYKEKEKDNLVVLEPIYVSLYGLKEIEQIKLAIDRVLHPILYSKGADYVKKFLKLAGKVVLKTNLDFNDDNNEDLTFDTTLDSFSLLSTKKSEDISSKLIVFDDFERCLIDTKDLLGCINNFVEHGVCHVIIIGDETHISKENKKDFIQFKEKTIGREFEVLPDIEGAINSFIDNDLGKNEWLIKHKTFISDCFKQTKYNNLRILRQCLYDFNILHRSIDSKLLEKGELFMMNLLGSYIVTYCEFKGESHETFKNWGNIDLKSKFGNEKEKEIINTFQNKYQLIKNIYHVNVLNTDHINKIIFDITTGNSIKEYIENILREMQGDVSLQKKLINFENLSNKEFIQLYKQLELSIVNNEFEDFYSMCYSMALVISFNALEIKSVSKKILVKAKNNIINYIKEVNSLDNIYQIKAVFNMFVQTDNKSFSTELGVKIKKEIYDVFTTKEGSLNNKMYETLMSISDDNVDSLIKLSEQLIPSHNCTYKMTSIFKNINHNKFVNRLFKLSNKSLNSFCLFLYHHYDFYYNLGDNRSNYANDLIFLEKLGESIQNVLQTKKFVDKHMYTKLLRYIECAIKRANGYKESIRID